MTAQGAGLLGSIFSARILGKTGFGELGMVRSTVLMFGVFAGIGLGMAATKYVAELRINDPPKAGRIIGLLMNTAFFLGGGVMLACLILAAPLARWVMNAPHLAGALQVGCFLLMLNTLNGVQLGVISGLEAFRIQSQVIILDGFLTVFLIPAGALVYGVTGAVGGLVLAALLGFLVKEWVTHRVCQKSGIPIIHSRISGEIPTLWRFTLPAILVGVSIQPFEWLSRLMLVQQPNGYAELGVFTAAYAWAQFVFFLPSQISGPILPILSNLLAGGEVIRLKKVVLSTQGLVMALALATALPLAALSPFILRSYGEDFVSGRNVLLVLISAYVICSGALITRAFFAASDRLWWQAAHTIIWGVLLVLVTHFFINRGGLGLALAYLWAYTLLAGLQFGTQASVMTRLREKGSNGSALHR